MSTEVRLCASSLSMSLSSCFLTSPVQRASSRIGSASPVPSILKELDVRARKKVLGTAAECEHSDHGGNGVFNGQDHPRGGQAFLPRAVVHGERLRVKSARQVILLESADVEIGEGGAVERAEVEGRVAVAAALVEDTLVLRGGDGAAWPHADRDSALGPHGRRVGRVDGDDGYVMPGQHPLLHRHGRRRKGVPIGLDVGQSLEDTVGDGEARWRAVVPHSDEHDAGATMFREIVGEGAHRPANALDGAVLARSGRRGRVRSRRSADRAERSARRGPTAACGDGGPSVRLAELFARRATQSAALEWQNV